MNTILKLIIPIYLWTVVVGAQSDISLSRQIVNSADDQMLSVDGYQVLNLSLDDLFINRSLTLSGKGNESVIDLSKLPYSYLRVGNESDHKKLRLKDLVIKNCIQIEAFADVTAENCRFENATLYVLDGSLYAKNCVFTGGRLKHCFGEGGALGIYGSSAFLDNCIFSNNSALLNASADDGPNTICGLRVGGSGGAISMGGSNVILLNPIIDGNTACYGGAITVRNGDLEVRGGRITNNRAVPINYTDPADTFGGIGGAIVADNESTVTLIHTALSGNQAMLSPNFCVDENSKVRIFPNTNLNMGNPTETYDSIALRAANGQYVHVGDSGNRRLSANSDKIGTSETFELIYTGDKDDEIALRAAVNGKYVSAVGGGGRELMADRDQIGSYETLHLICNGMGKWGLQTNNGKYVSAVGGGGRELMADRDRIGPWEAFDLIFMAPPD